MAMYDQNRSRKVYSFYRPAPKFGSGGSQMSCDEQCACCPTVLEPSGDTTGITDTNAINALTSVGSEVCLRSTSLYYDSGASISFVGDARILTTDERPAFWYKGSSATTTMSALPGTISRSNSNIDMILAPAANWPEQLTTCEATQPIQVIVYPFGSELINAYSSKAIGGIGDRLRLHSNGTSNVRMVDGGKQEAPVLYSNALFSTIGDLTFSPAPSSGSLPNELANYIFQIGDLTPADSYTKSTAMVGKSSGGVTLFDWQAFGASSPTGFLYWREAYSTVGWRVQMTSTDPTKSAVITANNGGAFIMMELGAASSVFYVTAANLGYHAHEVTGVGDTKIRCYTNRSVSILPGAGASIEIDWQTVASQGYEKKQHAIVSTTNATPTNIILATAASLADNKAFGLSAKVVAYHATTTARFKIEGIYRKVSSTLTKVGDVITVVGRDDPTMSISLGVDGSNNLIATVTGVAATNLVWEFYYDLEIGG